MDRWSDMTFHYACLFGNILQALLVASWGESWTGDTTWLSIRHAFLETCFPRFLYLPATSTLHPQVRSSGQFKFHCPHVHTWCDRKRRWCAHCAALNVHDIIYCGVNNTHNYSTSNNPHHEISTQSKPPCLFSRFCVILLRPAHYPHAVTWQCTTLQNMSDYDSTV